MALKCPTYGDVSAGDGYQIVRIAMMVVKIMRMVTGVGSYGRDDGGDYDGVHSL